MGRSADFVWDGERNRQLKAYRQCPSMYKGKVEWQINLQPARSRTAYAASIFDWPRPVRTPVMPTGRCGAHWSWLPSPVSPCRAKMCRPILKQCLAIYLLISCTGAMFRKLTAASKNRLILNRHLNAPVITTMKSAWSGSSCVRSTGRTIGTSPMCVLNAALGPSLERAVAGKLRKFASTLPLSEIIWRS